MTQTDPKIDLSSYGVKSPEEKAQDLATEELLWNAIDQDPENDNHHKAYTGHILRSGLLKEGSRRYGQMVKEKDRYSIEARRFAIYYQKQFVNIMFLTPTHDKETKKSAGLGYFLTFVAMMLLLTALLEPSMWYLGPFGLVYLAVYLTKKYMESKKKREKLKKL